MELRGFQRCTVVFGTMTLLGRIVRFLFWLLVVSWSVWLLRRVFGRMLQNSVSGTQRADESGSTQTSGTASRRLVRDPICGMHVDQTLAIPLREGNEFLHFCSIACRDAYVVGAKKFAANG
jgi:YHS domain-containing protein